MKRLTSFIFILAVIGSMSISDAFSAKRWVLIEEFTNASCGPCEAANPGFKAFLNSNDDKVIPIVFRTQGPGRDVMYLQNPTMYSNRSSYYVFDGVPSSFVNGLNNIYPGDPTSLQNEVNKFSSLTSPITITPTFTLDDKTMNIKVNVTSTSAITKKKLRVAVVEAYHYYEDAGTNNETKFYYVVREMLPDANGQDINITANESKDFTFIANPNKSLYFQYLYVVAFVQDDATKEVLQAGTSPRPDISNVDTKKIVPVTMTVDANQKHGYVEANSTVTRKVKVTNPNLKETTFGLSPRATLPADWSVSVEPREIKLAAGDIFFLMIRRSPRYTLSYANVNIDGYPINLGDNELGGYATGVVNALHKGTKIVNYVGAAAFDNYLAAVSSQSASYKGMTNYLQILDMEAMTAYPSDNFDVSVYNFDYFGLNNIGAQGLLGSNYNQSVAIRNNIKKSLDAGKDVLIFGEWEASNTFATTTYLNGQNFYKQDVGVNCTTQPLLRVSVDAQGNITGIIPYRVDGVAGDPISGGMSFSCNSHAYATSGQFFALMTDILKLETGSKAIPFLYSDATQSQIVGVRLENAAKGKLVYISAPPAGFEISQLASLYNKTLDWFYSTAAAGPKITAAVSSVSFGTVNKDEKSSKIVRVTNSGDEELVFTSIAIEDDANGVFTLGEGKNLKILFAGASADIEVIFTPTAKANYTGNLRLKTNATNTPDLKVALTGIGEDLTSVGEIGGKFYLNVSPNPVVSVSNVKYEINNDMPVNLSINLVDAQGNKVAELFNGVSGNGSYNLNLNSANFAAGAYYLSVLVDGQLNNVPVMIVK